VGGLSWRCGGDYGHEAGGKAGGGSVGGPRRLGEQAMTARNWSRGGERGGVALEGR